MFLEFVFHIFINFHKYRSNNKKMGFVRFLESSLIETGPINPIANQSYTYLFSG